MVWKEKRGRGGRPYLFFLLLSGSFWNFLSGIIRAADFFDFLWLCLLYMKCLCGTRRLTPGHHCSLSAGYLLRQNGGSWPSCINSESLRGWGLDSVGGLFVVLASFFSQNAVFRCPRGVSENVYDLPEEPSHSPVFPKIMPSHTSDKHTIWILLPLISHLKHPSSGFWRTLPQHFRWTAGFF